MNSKLYTAFLGFPIMCAAYPRGLTTLLRFVVKMVNQDSHPPATSVHRWVSWRCPQDLV